MSDIAKRVRAVVVAVAAVLCVWVLLAEVGVPMGGISSTQASFLADSHLMPEVNAEVAWEIPGPFVLFRGGATDAVSPWWRLVWAVTFTGTFPPASCGPAQPDGGVQRCPADNHTATVILDYRSGAFIMGTYGP